AQLYQEFKSFFPKNSVNYFVSYYDFYQPEAYLPQTDTYIEKEAEINENIDKLRLAATSNLLSRKDTIIVASVSSIYNLGSPVVYGKFVLELICGMKLSRKVVLNRLIDLQYSRSDFDFHRGTFRVRGEHIDIYPAYDEYALRLTLSEDKLMSIKKVDPLDSSLMENLKKLTLFPAKHYLTDIRDPKIFEQIRNDLKIRILELNRQGKKMESYRLEKKVSYDLEMIQEIGYVNGIENYSRYFDKRLPGAPPYTLLDYFSKPYGKEWLLFIDESHMTIPQIRGMYNGDHSRKQTLIDFGFRLPSALDNRPLTFLEFLDRIPQTIHVSATPAEWEINMSKRCSKHGIIQQLIRPTGILDPKIEIRPTHDQIENLVKEILLRKPKKERVLVTTLTKRMAEELTNYLNELQHHDSSKYRLTKPEDYPLVQYLHSDIQTLERSDILDELREGKYDVLVGINLLREGLDLPEVSLVAILDADKEGFLRSYTSLIQTMGRAARHIDGMVIMYADNITKSMKKAIEEIERRRIVQIGYNKKHQINPQNISKPIRDKLVDSSSELEDGNTKIFDQKKLNIYSKLLEIDPDSLTPQDKTKIIRILEKEMKIEAENLNFEKAALLRDKIASLKNS
ncbi:excinuclease ABC subunit UvrB, partial [Candidatus Gottesmanbacteria bacterium]|nr:excinuclease ABC subunit UvrB [Candidatus Gottesmanbacteria bacterium]